MSKTKIITNGDKSGRIDGSKNADFINGQGGDDRIGGHRGNDTIDGGAGSDKIGGGQDHDKLTGGAGKDQFIFNTFASKDTDHITDFKHGTDTIAFDLQIFTALDDGKLPSGEFRLGTTAKDGNDHIIYDKDTGKLYYDEDGKGGHAQHLIATLDNHAHTSLSASDILIF